MATMINMDERRKQAPPELAKTATWLRNKSGMKLKTGIMNGSRIDYFKGKSAIKALQTPGFAKQKGVPKAENEEKALEALRNVVQFAFFLKVDRGHSMSSTGPQGVKGPSMKVLQVNPMQSFEPESYYAWLLPGSQLTTYLGGIAMVTIILAGVMFPLWPTSLRVGVWYLSMAMLGVIGLFFALSIFRLVFYIVTIVVAKPGIWIFPNLFADVGFIDSFIPGWEWDIPPPKKKKRKNGEGKEESKRSKGSGKSTSAAQAREVPTINGNGAELKQRSTVDSKSATIEELSD